MCLKINQFKTNLFKLNKNNIEQTNKQNPSSFYLVCILILLCLQKKENL